MPLNLTPTFSNPKTTCKEQKIEKNEEEQKNSTTLRRGQTIRNWRQTSILRNKSNPRPFTHIRGRFRRILYIEHRRQGRRNVGFRTSPDPGVWGLYKLDLYQKRGRGRRDSGTEEKGGKKDVETRRQLGEEDEVRPEDRILQPEPNLITLDQSSTRRFPRPSRFSPKHVSPVTAQPDSLDPRPASPVQRWHASPAYLHFSFNRASLSPANGPTPASDRITRDRTPMWHRRRHRTPRDRGTCIG